MTHQFGNPEASMGKSFQRARLRRLIAERQRDKQCGHGATTVAGCAECQRIYRQAYRRVMPLTAEKRKKNHARRLANLAVESGKLVVACCERCGAENVEKHHPDYDNPLAVELLCPSCHEESHKKNRKGRR